MRLLPHPDALGPLEQLALGLDGGGDDNLGLLELADVLGADRARKLQRIQELERTARVVAALVVLQLILGASMVLSSLPQTIRVQHQAVGVAIWLTLFLSAYLAKRAAKT